MQLSKEQMQERIKANNDIINAYKSLNKAKSHLWDLEKNDTSECSWRNTKIDYWKDICAKYEESKLLNCYGDIFLITESGDGWYIGKRILWNLGLSDENYEITETIETDSDGDYDYTDYEIRVISEVAE